MADSMQEIWDEAIASMEFYRSKESDPKREYKVGDKVWLVGQNITTRRPSKKLDNKNWGPLSYQKDLLTCLPARTSKNHADTQCVPYQPSSTLHRRQGLSQTSSKTTPIVTEGEEEYEVDHVVAWEQRKNGLYYQIRWKGYDPIEDTMERAEKIAELPQIMRIYSTTPQSSLTKELQTSWKEYKRTGGKASNLTTSYSSSPPNNHLSSQTLQNPFYTMAPSAPTSLPRPPRPLRPRDARIVVDHTPSQYGENSAYHTNSHGAMVAIDSIATKTPLGAAIASLEAPTTPSPSTRALPLTTSPWPSGGTADGSPPTPSNALNG
ncbi:chromo domain protein [Ceratobasidium sp. AG-Ba]|nr:chromo domain protein [Ceratobasidium sp. AG-Ba]